MKTQENIISGRKIRQQRNQVLAIYIVFVTALVVSFSIATALTTLS